MLKDIYTDTLCPYLLMKPSCVVRQGDCLSSIIFNLDSEPIIRNSKEENG